jgi:hypothetical protein
MAAEKQQLSLYVHTHWDREWYWAFERYRTVLVSAMKLAIQAVESGEVPNFHLDGQVCALEDFLELEPGFADRVKKLNAANKLAIGPWYVLADQMLVSGESLIRNLEVGLKGTRQFGEPMMVGYSPDTFGHSQDLPRILKGFGINSAIVWRGVPELDQGPEFLWRSPDGSEVLAIALTKGYYQTTFHEAEGSTSEAKIDSIAESLLPWVNLKLDRERGVILASDERSTVYSRNTHGCLVPVGGDHLKPPSNLAQIIELVEKRIGDLLKKNGTASEEGVCEIKLNSIQLPDYLKMVAQAVNEPATPVRMIEGELRENSFARQYGAGYMLPGVLSTRLYLKRENRILEHRLSRVCEPVSALMSMARVTRYPAFELDNAWKYLLKNHPHDSMCGCSVDDVHREMMTRFASIHQILDILDQRVKQDLLVPGVHEWSHEDSKKERAKTKSSLENAGFGRGDGALADPDVPLTSLAVFNLSTEESSGPVKVSLAIPDDYFAKDVDKHISGDASDVAKEAAKDVSIGAVKDAVPTKRTNQEMMDAANKYLSDICGDKSNFQIDSVRFETELFGELGGVPLYKDVHYLEGWLWAPSNAPLGVTKLALHGHGSSGSESQSKVSAGSTRLQNEFFEVSVAPDGRLSIKVSGVEGKSASFNLRHQFRDVADAGDSYNFDPILNDVPVKARFTSSRVLKSGPLVASISLKYRIDLPAGLVEDAALNDWGEFSDTANLVAFKRTEKTIEHEIETIVKLKRGIPLVFFDSSWKNLVGDHRLEVLFDTGTPVTTTWSENHFSLVERKMGSHEVKLPVEKWTETPLDRFPCQRFFIANGQAFYNLGLPEYGVEDNGVSITALRAISMLSRKRLLTRGGGAGPYLPVPDGNCIGENKISYGWAPIAVLDVLFAERRKNALQSENSEQAKNAGQSKNASSSKNLTLSDGQRVLAYKLAEQFEGNLWATPLTPESEDVVPCGSMIKVSNENLRCIAFYSTDAGKSLLLRLLNVSMKPQSSMMSVSVKGAKVERVDLDGKSAGELEKCEAETGAETQGRPDGGSVSSFTLDSGINELVTLRISV